jgi:hypothetical protein
MRAAVSEIGGPGVLAIAHNHKPALPSGLAKSLTLVTLPLIRAHPVRKLRMLVAFKRGRRDVGRFYLPPARFAAVRSLRFSGLEILRVSMSKCNARNRLLILFCES